MEGLTIRKIINQIANGGIRIPSFQRGFVWEPEDVAFFLDSLYKGYPIGSILLWRTKERLHVERQLGRFILPEPTKDYPIDYVLDGQQRLTSIFSVFQTDLTPEKDESWMDIYYNIGMTKTAQQNAFVALKKEQVDFKKHFPMNVLFDTIQYRKVTRDLEDDEVIELDELLTVFQETVIPVQLMETEDKGNVAIVFERINRAGVPLDSFQLLTAWSWSTNFDLQERLDELSAELSECGFEGLAENQDLLMKCFTGYILGKASPSAIMELNGDKIRDNFDDIKCGLKSAVDFLKKELNIHSLKYLPYPTMMVALVRFFGGKWKNGTLYSDRQRKELIQWFWKCCFSRRYSSGVNNIIEDDLISMQKLRIDDNHHIASFSCEINPHFFTENIFNITSVNTKTFIVMLACNNPKSFISGANVDLSRTLQVASVKEFHHIFPDKFLQRNGKNRKQIYQLANFCFLNNADNQKIKDKDPKEYVKMINKSALPRILEAAICPSDTFKLEFEEFIIKRNNMLITYAQKLIE